MDSKGKMPHIKSDVNKLDDKKKSAGLLATLFGGAGGNAGGMGGLGGLGSGAAAGGGMLATKAGVIALLVIGSAVAGGVGMVGFKMFGPGDSDHVGGNLALFAPKPKEAQADPNAVPPVAKDGASTSLDYMSQAAAKDKAADASAGSDQSAGGAAAGSSSDASATGTSGASGAINSGSGGKGSLGSMKALASGKNFGALSGAPKGGGGTSSASAGSPASSVQSGAVSAFKPSAGGRVSGSTGRGVASRIGGNLGRNQLGAVGRDHVNAGSSMAAGQTYDGSGANGSAIGPNGTAIGMDGSGSGAQAQPTSISQNTAPNVNEQSPPIPKPVHVVVPWEKAVQRAQMLVGLAIGLALLSSMLGVAPWAYYAKMAIGAVISMIGAYIVTLGAQIMSGSHGQPLQGSVVIAAGLGTIAMGVMTMFTASDGQAAQTDITSKDYGSLTGAKPAAPPNAGAAGAKDAGFLAGINPVVLLGGGLAAVSAISLFFAPKPKPVEVPEGQRGPDVSYHQTAPPQNYGV